MFLKTLFSRLFFRFFSNCCFFIFKKAKNCMYKAGSFPDIPESSNFNSAIKVRRLVKRTYLQIRNPSNIYAKELMNFLKMKCFFFKNINMKPEILDSSKNILNVRSVKYVYISFWHTNNRATGAEESTREQVPLLWISMWFMSSFLIINLPISCRESCEKTKIDILQLLKL